MAEIVFVRTDPATVSDWLHNRLEEINAREYGEAESCIVIVETDERLRVFSYGPTTDNATLKMVDRGRALIKAKLMAERN